MRVYAIETHVLEGGTIHLEAVPFPPGQIVDVIVLARPDKSNNKSKRSLKGTVIKYDSPLEPVVIKDVH